MPRITRNHHKTKPREPLFTARQDGKTFPGISRFVILGRLVAPLAFLEAHLGGTASFGHNLARWFLRYVAPWGGPKLGARTPLTLGLGGCGPPHSPREVWGGGSSPTGESGGRETPRNKEESWRRRAPSFLHKHIPIWVLGTAGAV